MIQFLLFKGSFYIPLYYNQLDKYVLGPHMPELKNVLYMTEPTPPSAANYPGSTSASFHDKPRSCQLSLGGCHSVSCHFFQGVFEWCLSTDWRYHGFLAVEKWKVNFEIVHSTKAILYIQDTCPCHHSWTFEDS